MSETMLLGVAIGVFVMLIIGIALTIYEFHRAGSEPVKKSDKGQRPER
ncbi:hypothetical protein [Microbulbifer yueqingensis]|uniref:Uncharacterized protein n=1 Tax=Microbulbifer yueqingensis TaxID=658219 RepID=A0A1G9BYC4_9GAMM|nr:hypothetical protein [Microbulbifer yueqingensis]SDK44449.1 hypothetical protein SAMN05216212_2410 [Microbulbifer yueqingensis]